MTTYIFDNGGEYSDHTTYFITSDLDPATTIDRAAVCIPGCFLVAKAEEVMWYRGEPLTWGRLLRLKYGAVFSQIMTGRATDWSVDILQWLFASNVFDGARQEKLLSELAKR